MVAATRKPPAQKLSAGVTPISAWKKSSGKLPIELPSGNSMLINRHTFKALLAQGIIPNSLMAIVQSSLDKGKSAVDVPSIVSDPEKIDEMLEMVDNIVIFAVMEPTVHPVPETEKKRDLTLLYVDEIDETDKTFIFQYVTGGTSNLEQFRTETTELLGTVQSGKTMALPTKRPARTAARRR